MGIRKDIKKAMADAKKQVIKEAAKKPKKKKINRNPEQKITKTEWIVDQWGTQGEAFFDGKLYWILLCKPDKEPGMWYAVPTGLSEEEWEDYKKHPRKTGLPPSKERNSGTTVTAKQSSSTRQTTSSTKRSEKKPSKKSPTQSGKTMTPIRQVSWQ